MIDLSTIKIFLTVVRGLCWTIVYIEGIRVGLRDRSYAIPFLALALNLAWELLHTISGFQLGDRLQGTINATWLLLDLGIIFTYFKFGRKYFSPALTAAQFAAWSTLLLLMAFAVQYAFTREFGTFRGGAYAAFLQNLIMSILFIQMLVSRGSRAGQSLLLAVNKWLGTLAPTIQFGVFNNLGLQQGHVLIVVAGGFCCVFDLIYIWLLARTPRTP
ncbi:MAG TPA: hypothetical protein VF251_13920 [Pyrinomonadaceae bacterium]